GDLRDCDRRAHDDVTPNCASKSPLTYASEKEVGPDSHTHQAQGAGSAICSDVRREITATPRVNRGERENKARPQRGIGGVPLSSHVLGGLTRQGSDLRGGCPDGPHAPMITPRLARSELITGGLQALRLRPEICLGRFDMIVGYKEFVRPV